MADNSRSGTSICGVLLIVFVVLKLTDVIDWSWWWVLSPLLGQLALLVLLIFIKLIAIFLKA